MRARPSLPGLDNLIECGRSIDVGKTHRENRPMWSGRRFADGLAEAREVGGNSFSRTSRVPLAPTQRETGQARSGRPDQDCESQVA